MCARRRGKLPLGGSVNIGINGEVFFSNCRSVGVPASVSIAGEWRLPAGVPSRDRRSGSVGLSSHVGRYFSPGGLKATIYPLMGEAKEKHTAYHGRS